MKTTWWLRIVGMFYLFLALGSVWVVFINPKYIRLGHSLWSK